VVEEDGWVEPEEGEKSAVAWEWIEHICLRQLTPHDASFTLINCCVTLEQSDSEEVR